MANIVNEVWIDFVSLVFPETCIGCNRLLVKGETQICSVCRYELPKASDNSELKNKFIHEPKITFVDAFLPFRKFGLTQTLLHQLKYRGNYELGIILGAWYGSHLMNNQNFARFEIMVPVPLHKRKLQTRGYNQSQAIAEGIHSVTNLRLEPAMLERSKHTQTQTKKHKVERWQNVDNIFVIQKPKEVVGKKVLLIDDVLTTGSTLSSCAAEFLANGASEIGICTLAYAHK